MKGISMDLVWWKRPSFFQNCRFPRFPPFWAWLLRAVPYFLCGGGPLGVVHPLVPAALLAVLATSTHSASPMICATRLLPGCLLARCTSTRVFITRTRAASLKSFYLLRKPLSKAV